MMSAAPYSVDANLTCFSPRPLPIQLTARVCAFAHGILFRSQIWWLSAHQIYWMLRRDKS